VIEFQRYRTTETALLYIDKQGIEVSTALTSINFDLTQKLNFGESPALELPGMQVRGSASKGEQQVSLAEAARLVTKPPAGPVRHIFTDDDVVHSGATGADTSSTKNSNPDTWKDRLSSMEATVDSLQNMDADSLARRVLGNLDVDFPGRREWQEELLSRKQAVADALQNASRAYEEFYQLRDVLTVRAPFPRVTKTK
jgi:hypothetical protein